MSPDTQAILLLCARLDRSAPCHRAQPLTPRELRDLAKWLKSEGKVPADLLGDATEAAVPSAHRGRIKALMGRGESLASAAEAWERIGIWVIGRSDPEYPSRLAQRLGGNAPPLLFGAGSRHHLDQGGMAIVGSRDADEQSLAFADALGAACARDDLAVVSGGARGVDLAAMHGALSGRGSSVGVLPYGLAQAVVSKRYQPGLRSHSLALVSAVDPHAPFSAGNALGRNRFIYCMADAAVVVHSGTTGGTWSGASQCIGHGWVPVYVRTISDRSAGNHALLQLPGTVLPFPTPVPASVRTLTAAAPRNHHVPAQLDLFGP